MCCAWFLSCQSFCHCFLASSLLALLLGQGLCALCAQNVQSTELAFPDAAVMITVMIKIHCFESHVRSESRDCIANTCKETHGYRGEMKYFLLWIFLMEGLYAHARVIIWWFWWDWSQWASVVQKVSIYCKLNFLGSLCCWGRTSCSFRERFNLRILKWNILPICPAGDYWLLSQDK